MDVILLLLLEAVNNLPMIKFSEKVKHLLTMKLAMMAMVAQSTWGQSELQTNHAY